MWPAQHWHNLHAGLRSGFRLRLVPGRATIGISVMYRLRSPTDMLYDHAKRTAEVDIPSVKEESFGKRFVYSLPEVQAFAIRKL